MYFASVKFDARAKRRYNNHTSKINVFPVSHTISFLRGGKKMYFFAYFFPICIIYYYYESVSSFFYRLICKNVNSKILYQRYPKLAICVGP